MVDKIEQDGLSDEIETKLNSAINEAPEDGKQYARKDADWVEVEGGGSMPEFKMEDATDAELNSGTPLKEGDAWVYNEAEQKFKPKPVVPTVVVTEFPAEPDANTLYIKVV
ncbi:MAG: hypothetical protein GY799_14690 [Desulfobulbaceae bacterium]|nr:hypothetical protein [Desulfobulbaceae bacterium]